MSEAKGSPKNRKGIPMNLRRALSFLLLIAFFLLAPSLAPAQSLDQYGGYVGLSVPGGATGYFRLAKMGDRWVFATPDGNAFWMRSVYAVSTMDGGSGYSAAVETKYAAGSAWAQFVRRLKSWGFNTLGEYTDLHALPISAYGGNPNTERAPFIWALNAGYYGIRAGSFKNIYLGVDTAQNPRTYIGMFPDVFDPAFASNVDAFASDFNGSSAAGSVFGGASKLDACPWLIGITTDDGDYTTGFGPGPDGEASQGKIHPHLGWVAAVTAPTQATTAEWPNWRYPDPVVHTKRAWRDFLAAKYTTIDALNAAWGSSYTTFDTDGGWPGGSGLLDENGRHQWIGSDPYKLSGASARAKADLDEFMGKIADKYFSVYATKIRQYLPHHLVFTPVTMQAGTRRPILEAAGRYVDAIQSSGVPGGPSYSLHQEAYNTSGKPLFLWTTITAQADSNIVNPGLTGWGPSFNKDTQADRGNAYASEIAGLLSLKGSDGNSFIVGIGWWEWCDKVVSGENMNFGLVDVLDNAYDGNEAVIAVGTDPWGYRTGGETKNYGNFLGAVTQANAQIYARLVGAVAPRVPTRLKVISITSP